MDDEEAGSVYENPEGGEDEGSSHAQVFEMADPDQPQDTEFLFLGDSASSLESGSEITASLSESGSEGLLQQQQGYLEDAALVAATASSAGDRFTTPSSSPSLTQELSLPVPSGENSDGSQQVEEEEEGEGFATTSLSCFFDPNAEISSSAVDDAPEASGTPPPEQDPSEPSVVLIHSSATPTDNDDDSDHASRRSSHHNDNNNTDANRPIPELGDSSDYTSSTTEVSSTDYHPDSPFSPDFSSPSPPPPPPSQSPHPRAQQRWNARMIRSLGDDPLDGHLASGESSSSDGSNNSRKRKRTETPRRMATRRTRVRESEDDESGPASPQGSGSAEIRECITIPRGGGDNDLAPDDDERILTCNHDTAPGDCRWVDCSGFHGAA
ncbi:hypothetical protein EC968_006345, partial [Mortierella alpina]